MQLTDEQKQELVDAAVADIRKRAIDQAVENLSAWTRSAVSESIYTEVQALVKAEIVPAIRETLMANKSILVEAAVLAAGDIAEKLREAMVTSLVKRLATSYQSDQIFKAMFGA